MYNSIKLVVYQTVTRPAFIDFDDQGKSQLFSGSGNVDPLTMKNRRFVRCVTPSYEEVEEETDGNDKFERQEIDKEDSIDGSQSLAEDETDLVLLQKSYKLKCQENVELKRKISSLQQTITVLPSKKSF
jgi:hypothetical protein